MTDDLDEQADDAQPPISLPFPEESDDDDTAERVDDGD
jgi:hypothetical protein